MAIQGETHGTGEVLPARHRLGDSGIDVFPVALGTATFGWTLGSGPAMQVLDVFVDRGGNLIDTADKYASGLSEHIIGTWMASRKNRERVRIATKVGRGDEFPGLSTENIRRGVDASLSRLQTDYIDLLYFHAPDPDTPLMESLAAVDDLIRAGKVLALGASNFSAELLTEARVNAASGLPRFEACALEYSLLNRDIVAQVEPLLEAQHLPLMPYFALAHGYLGNLRNLVNPDLQFSRHRRAMSYANKRGAQMLKAVKDVAREHQTAISTVALAWVLQHHGVGAASVGADSVEQLEQLMRAPGVQLTRAQMALLSAE